MRVRVGLTVIRKLAFKYLLALPRFIYHGRGGTGTSCRLDAALHCLLRCHNRCDLAHSLIRLAVTYQRTRAAHPPWRYFSKTGRFSDSTPLPTHTTSCCEPNRHVVRSTINAASPTATTAKRTPHVAGTKFTSVGFGAITREAVLAR